jgi:16S rRNA (adenine1518-N6/adenine1519-N6)-dimethyltransferase
MPVRKRFGQHFLHDPGIIRRIVDAVAPARRAPGRGRSRPRRPDLESAGARGRDWTSSRSTAISRARSRPIRAPRRICACTSRTCSTRISCAARGRTAAAYRRQSALQHFDAAAVSPAAAARRDRDMHFMLQKEVVDRMAAQPGGKEYGRLTVMLAAVRRGRGLFDVGPAHSSRRPRCGPPSCACARRAAALRHRQRRRALRTLVTAAFSHRRKTLRNGLKGPADRRGHRSLRHRSAIAPGNPGARAIRPARRALLAASAATCATKRRLRYTDRSWPAYQKVLVLLDLSPTANRCRRRTRSGRHSQAQMVLLHVVEFVPVEPMGESLMPTVQIEEDLVSGARQARDSGARLGLTAAPRCGSKRQHQGGDPARGEEEKLRI